MARVINTRIIRKGILAAAVLCLGFFFTPALAQSQVLTDVKVIHATTGSRHVDPGLASIISELESVFRYTSYTLLNEKRMNLGFNQKGQVTLPGGRSLFVTPSGMDGKRIRYQISIQKNSSPIFQTQVLLRNGSSITIGGPQHGDGVLLFNISGSAR